MLLDYIQNADITIMSKPSVKFSFTNDSHRFAIQTEQGVEVRDINSGKLFTYLVIKILKFLTKQLHLVLMERWLHYHPKKK
jgi:hypothetical protein